MTIRQRCQGCGTVVYLAATRKNWVCPVCDHTRQVV